MLRKTLMAMAGVTAGASSVLAGTAAHAAAPATQTIDHPLSEVASDRAPRAVCQEATEYPLGSRHYYLPTITRDGGETGCTLQRGDVTNGVFKLQDALRLCHGQTAVMSDGNFGAITEAGLNNVTGSRIYVGNYRDINWPLYNASGTFVNACVNL